MACYDRSGEEEDSPGEGVGGEVLDIYPCKEEGAGDRKDCDHPATGNRPVDLADPDPAMRALFMHGHGRSPGMRIDCRSPS